MKEKQKFIGKFIPIITFIILAITLTACDTSDSGGGFDYEYGPGGGIIFYKNTAGFTVYQNASDTTGVTCHFLEAALYDISPRAWASEGDLYPLGYSNTSIPGTETGIGTGRKNTAVILAVDSNAPAAKACNDCRDNAYADWFLPSKDELDELYKFYIAHGKGSYANLKTKYYWSSSQVSGTQSRAWDQDFGNGHQWNDYKYMTTVYVRAIRAY